MVMLFSPYHYRLPALNVNMIDFVSLTPKYGTNFKLMLHIFIDYSIPNPQTYTIHTLHYSFLNSDYFIFE